MAPDDFSTIADEVRSITVSASSNAGGSNYMYSQYNNRSVTEMQRQMVEAERELARQVETQMYSPVVTWDMGHLQRMADSEKKPKKYKKSKLTPDTIQQSFKKVIAEISKMEKTKIKSLNKEIDNYEQQIQNIEKDIKKKTADIKEIVPFSKSKKLKSIEEDFEKIKNNPKIAGIYYYGNSILIETNDLYVSNFIKDKHSTIKKKVKGPKLLGKFSIRLLFESSRVFLSVDNMTFISDVYDLPTIQSGKCCWGNIAGDIRKDLSQLNVEEFVNDIVAYIEAPANQAAYISWDRYFKDQKKIVKFIPREPSQEIYINLPIPTAQQGEGSTQWVVSPATYPVIGFTSGLNTVAREESLDELEGRLVRFYMERLDSIISRREAESIRRLFTDTGVIFVSSFLISIMRGALVSDFHFNIISRGRENSVTLEIHLRTRPETMMRTMYIQSLSASAPSEANIAVTENRYALDIPTSLLLYPNTNQLSNHYFDSHYRSRGY